MRGPGFWHARPVRSIALVVAACVALTAGHAHAQAGPVAPRPDAPPMASRPDLMKPEVDRSSSPGDAPADVARLVVGAGTHVALGPAPAASVGLLVSTELANYRWSIGLEGRYDLPSSGPALGGAGARSSLAGVQVVPCLRAQGMWACAVVLVSNLHTSASRDPDVRANDDFLLFGVGARLAIHLSLPADFALRIGAQVLGHPLAAELTHGDTRLFKSSAVSATLGPTIVRVF